MSKGFEAELKSAFLQSPFPEYLAEDEEIDVVIMEFSQTDFSQLFFPPTNNHSS